MIGTAEAVPFHKASHSVFSCKLCGPAQLQSKPNWVFLQAVKASFSQNKADWVFPQAVKGYPFPRHGHFEFSARSLVCRPRPRGRF
jgi:hypothetical protein